MPKRKRVLKIYQQSNKIKNGLFFILKVVLGILGSLILVGVSIFLFYAKDLPRPEKFTEAQLIQATKIYDRTGEIVLSSIYQEEKRTYLDLEKFPEILKEAIIATEDARFYQHPGVDFKAGLRALMVDLKLRAPKQGGSTITQQLIRSIFLTNEKTIERKLKEIILAIELDKKYSKEQILEWYLNQIPFGINIYGAQEASLTYFEKPIWEISLAQSAILAAIIKAPGYLSPYGEHLDELLSRKNYVLNRMQQENFIGEEEAEAAKKSEVEFSKLPKTLAPHFITFVRQQLEEKYGEKFLETKGLKIYTTLDWGLQKKAEEIVRKGVEKNKKAFGAYNGALVAIEPESGGILAMVGSADPNAESFPLGCNPRKTCKFVPDFNVATQGERQPGSSFKPFVYATAFSKGFDDKTIVLDEETNFGVFGGKAYIPQNYDGRFRGPVTLREALAQSLNVPSVKVLNNLAGLKDSIGLAKLMGITTLEQDPSFYGLSLVLGGGGVKLLDMVASYSVFANNGFRISPSPILKIEDAKGNIIYQNKKTPKKVLESSVCDLITDVLSDNQARSPIFGENSSLRFDEQKVAVKTGTSDDYVDASTIGYAKNIVTGVWVGNNDNSAIVRGLGISTAGPIWRAFMEEAINKD